MGQLKTSRTFSLINFEGDFVRSQFTTLYSKFSSFEFDQMGLLLFVTGRPFPVCKSSVCLTLLYVATDISKVMFLKVRSWLRPQCHESKIL